MTDIEDKINAVEFLVDHYSRNFRQYQLQNYNETELRVDFVNPFFEALGWDVLNKAGLPQHMREVTHEATVLVEEKGTNKNKKPDYSFRVGTELFYYLETKKPSVNITTDKNPAFQLRRYGWSGNLKVSVLTNFTDLYIYDCSVRPIEGNDIGTALIAHYHYTEYVDKFEEIYELLSKEAILTGKFDEYFQSITTPFRHEPFNEYFLELIKQWRDDIGSDIARNNSEINDATLNIAVQRILDRIIFLRVCEDRNLEHYESLKNVSSYESLKIMFKAADKKYDSGLFDVLEEDKVRVSDSVIIDIFKNLYYPYSSFEFSVIDPYIIGQIYELFLDETLHIENDRTLSCIKKPEAIDSQGAVNTPKNITDIIVEQTLSPLYKDKTIQEVEKYKVADICCGSGNFLLSSFEYIVNFYTDYLINNSKTLAESKGDIITIVGSENYQLSFELRRKILTNNIWGVDIDPLAVEVTKFSLLLKALEDVSADELCAFSSETHKKILPNLDSNIRIGNSLVGKEFANFNPDVYHNSELLMKLHMFDWQSEFGSRGFDAIVGNPPYIRVQNIVHYSPEEYSFYKSEYSGFDTATSQLLDKYYLFIERALSLLNPNGMLGYIVPHKFMTIKSGEILRRKLTENDHVYKILHFGTFQVFKNRSTYTCILVLSSCKQNTFCIGFVHDWNKFLFEHSVSCIRYPNHYLSENPWTFLPDDISEKLVNVKSKCISLSELTDIFVGVQTSADKIYILHPEHEDDNYIYVNVNDKEKRIEKAILRVSIYDAQLKKYHHEHANSYIIFPYKNDNGKPVLYQVEEMKEKFPYAYEYLKFFRNELDKRNMPNRTNQNWYAYGRAQSLKRFMNGDHLVWPVLSLDSNYVFDDEMVVFTGGGNGPFYGLEMRKEVKLSVFYIQALLNHWLLESLVRMSASTFRGGYYSHSKQYLADLPIYNINFENPSEKAKHDEIVSSVQTLMKLSSKIDRAKNSAEKKVLQDAENAVNMKMNGIIDELYGVVEMNGEELDETE